jgi:hypothetical protein
VNQIFLYGLLALAVLGVRSAMNRFVQSAASAEAREGLRAAYASWQIKMYLMFILAAALIYFFPSFGLLFGALAVVGSQMIIASIASEYGAVASGGRSPKVVARNYGILIVITIALQLYILISKYDQGQPFTSQVSPNMVLLALLAVGAIVFLFVRSRSE